MLKMDKGEEIVANRLLATFYLLERKKEKHNCSLGATLALVRRTYHLLALRESARVVYLYGQTQFAILNKFFDPIQSQTSKGAHRSHNSPQTIFVTLVELLFIYKNILQRSNINSIICLIQPQYQNKDLKIKHQKSLPSLINLQNSKVRKTQLEFQLFQNEFIFCDPHEGKRSLEF